MENEQVKIQELTSQFEQLLKLLVDDDIKLLLDSSEEHLLFSVQTEGGEKLLGENGETLSALTLVLRKIAEKHIPHEKRILLDINNYRKQREEEIQGIAKMLGERARVLRHDVEMEPMTSYERLIVHSVFQNTPHITTESIGEGRSRRVVIKYREKKAEETPTNTSPETII